MKKMTGGGATLNKEAFTLIELLAVIVILAIIALIATPIVLNIIKDVKMQAGKRSAENYIKAVEQAIVRENLTREYNPNNCEIIDNKLICYRDFNKQESLGELRVEIDGTKPKGAKLYILNNKIEKYSVILNDQEVSNLGKYSITFATAAGFTVDGSLSIEENGEVIINIIPDEFYELPNVITVTGSEYEYNKENRTVIIKNPIDNVVIGLIPYKQICMLQEGASKTYGSKYKCRVNDTQEYDFYVLSGNTSTTDLTPTGVTTDLTQPGIESYNLIMYSNINSDGVPVDNNSLNNRGKIQWITNNDYITAGGIQDDWNNNIRSNKGPVTAMTYLTLATSTWENLSQPLDIMYNDEKNRFNNFHLSGYSRLPYFKEIEMNENSCKTQNVDNFLCKYCDTTIGVYGYWAFSSSKYGIESYAFGINCDTNPDNNYVYRSTYGVRPVITVLKFNLN